MESLKLIPSKQSNGGCTLARKRVNLYLSALTALSIIYATNSPAQSLAGGAGGNTKTGVIVDFYGGIGGANSVTGAGGVGSIPSGSQGAGGGGGAGITGGAGGVGGYSGAGGAGGSSSGASGSAGAGSSTDAGSGGGGGAAGAVITSSGSSSSTLSGGAGGAGGSGGSCCMSSSGGGGGAGGYGAIVNSSVVFTNSGSITGGAGGAGGAVKINYFGFGPNTFLGGNGGSGGVGAFLGSNGMLNNSGTIVGGAGGAGGAAGINSGGRTSTAGAAGSSAPGVYVASGSNSTITNTGAINGGTGSYGIQNAGTISALNNAQVGLTYTGILPTNYSIIVNNPTNFGTLTVTSPTGATNFGIYANSTLSVTTYSSVLAGVTSSNIANYGSIFNVWNNFNSSYKWQLVQGAAATSWDLVVAIGASNILAGSTNLLSAVGGSLNPVLEGGTLRVDSATTTSSAFSVKSAGGTIDANGLRSTFSGAISDAVGDSGRLTIVNTGNAGEGVVVLAASNTHSGGTEVQAGASLSIASSNALGSGVLDLVGSATVPATLITTETMTISNPITVSGDPVFNVAPGTTTTVSSPITDGVSAGDVVASGGGTLNLTAVNTYTGPTIVDAGSTLTLSGSGAIATSSSVVDNGTLDISATTAGATLQALSGSGSVVLGAQNLSIANANSTFSGSISGTGGLGINGGSQVLTGVNSYTGTTSIGSGSTLFLSGSGAIASSSLANNGSFNISGKNSNVSVLGYSQSSTGNLAMNFSPSANQKLLVAGAASLAGGLSLNSVAGTYSAGRYSLLTANSVSGTFSSLTSNLSSLTRLGYSLAYSANDVYLVFTPNSADTQQSLVNTSQALQNTYTLQNSVLANSFSYDCNEFGINNICISAGGRNTAVSAANGLNNTSALLIAAYRPYPNYRIGAYADQNLSMNNAGNTVNLGNNTPLLGLFGAWSERLDGTGIEIKVSAAYGQKNTTLTRQVVATSEPGSGSSQLNSQGAQVAAKYGFGVSENVIISPYAGVRYTQNNMGAYTEGASSTVTAPLSYSALNTNATTALVGLGASYRVIPTVTTYASAGIETDTNTANGTYSATGITGLTPINFNANPIKTRPTATLGAYYDVLKNQRIGINGIYRQEPYQGVSTTTIMATYTVGL